MTMLQTGKLAQTIGGNDLNEIPSPPILAQTRGLVPSQGRDPTGKMGATYPSLPLSAPKATFVPLDGVHPGARGLAVPANLGSK